METREAARIALASITHDEHEPAGGAVPDRPTRRLDPWVESEAHLVHNAQGEVESIVGTIRSQTS